MYDRKMEWQKCFGKEFWRNECYQIWCGCWGRLKLLIWLPIQIMRHSCNFFTLVQLCHAHPSLPERSMRPAIGDVFTVECGISQKAMHIFFSGWCKIDRFKCCKKHVDIFQLHHMVWRQLHVLSSSKHFLNCWLNTNSLPNTFSLRVCMQSMAWQRKKIGVLPNHWALTVCMCWKVFCWIRIILKFMKHKHKMAAESCKSCCNASVLYFPETSLVLSNE